AAIFLGEDHPEEAELPHFLDVVPGELVLLVVPSRLGCHLSVRELAKHVAEAGLFLGQFVKVVRPCFRHRFHPGPRAGQTGISQTSSTMSSASVDFRISSTVTPGARSWSLSPCGVTSMTARSVMMRSTTFFPVSGNVHFLRILELPSLAVWSIVTTTRFAPATRSIAPPFGRFVLFSIRLGPYVPWKMVSTKTPGVMTVSGSITPGSTSCSTSAIVCSEAVANTGLKFRADIRYTRFPLRSPRCAFTNAKSLRIG